MRLVNPFGKIFACNKTNNNRTNLQLKSWIQFLLFVFNDIIQYTRHFRYNVRTKNDWYSVYSRLSEQNCRNKPYLDTCIGFEFLDYPNEISRSLGVWMMRSVLYYVFSLLDTIFILSAFVISQILACFFISRFFSWTYFITWVLC